MSKVKLIGYKGVVFDYFELWNGEEELGTEGDVIDVTKVDCMSTQVCPWCCKQYGFYAETERKPESVEEEIVFYENEASETRMSGAICGVAGCNNGWSDSMYVNWSDCEVID